MVSSALSHIGFHSRRRNLPPIYDDESHWYQSWYFDLRLEEEASRAERYSLGLIVLVICIPAHIDTGTSRFRNDLRAIATGKLRRTDIPTLLTSHELAICLTHTRAEQAATVINRLRRALAPYSPAFGQASYPEDGEDIASFLAIAESRALESCEHFTPTPVAVPQSMNRRRL